MSEAIAILIALLTIFAAYSFIAVCICLELNEDRFHWWCPLCRLTRILARRFE